MFDVGRTHGGFVCNDINLLAFVVLHIIIIILIISKINIATYLEMIGIKR